MHVYSCTLYAVCRNTVVPAKFCSAVSPPSFSRGMRLPGRDLNAMCSVLSQGSADDVKILYVEGKD